MPASASPRAAQLYVTLECARPLAGSSRHALAGLERVLLGRGSDRRARRAQDDVGPMLHLEVPDARMSAQHARLSRIGAAWIIDDAGSRNGTWVNGAPAARTRLQDGDVIEAGETLLVFREAQVLGEAPLDQERPEGTGTLIPAFAAELQKLERAAPSTVPVVVRGESGTGKELAARAVHLRSGRSGAFVAVNCAAIPEALAAAELFGARRGAYSGASEDRPGLIAASSGGTLFLDEVAELSPAIQATLLRALQEREVLPLGATRPVPVDLRVVSATHRDLRARAADGSFRHDLLARISGVEIDLPPLRHRREELGSLVASILARVAAARSPRLSPAVGLRLLAHPWPLNVRELELALAAAVAITTGDLIEEAALPATIGRGPAVDVTADDDRLRAELQRLLSAHDGNVAAVARSMDRDPRQIRRWMERLGLQR